MTVDFAAVAPLGFIGAGVVFVLLLDALLSRGRPAPADPGSAEWSRRNILADARVATTLALACTVCLAFSIYTAGFAFAAGAHSSFGPQGSLLVLGPLSTFAIVLIGVSVLMCVLLSIAYLPALHIHHRGYFALLMSSAGGMVLVVCAVDFMVLLVGVELMTLPLYALVALPRGPGPSGEAALKLALTGAFASAVMLLGSALLYGATGSTSYAALQGILAEDHLVALVGVALLLVGLGFKVMAFPFHSWAPDVVEGAPTVVATVVAVAAKTAAVVVFLRIVAVALPDPFDVSASAERLRVVIGFMSGGAMLVGSAMALVQTNVKRMFAHAGVAHAGMLLLGLLCATEQARAAVLFYLLAYAFMTIGAFGVLIAMSQGGRDCESFDAFAGLGVRHPTLAAAMSLFLFALSGLPGTAGFLAKFLILASAVNAGQIALVLIAAFASVVLVACYLRIPTAMYMRAPSSRGTVEPGSAELLVLALCAAAVLYLGLVPDADPFGTGFRALETTARAAAFARWSF